MLYNYKYLIGNSISFRKIKEKDLMCQAVRLFAGASDGIPGLIIDNYGPFLVSSLYNENLSDDRVHILKVLEKSFPYKEILIKYRNSEERNELSYFSNSKYKKQGYVICNEGKERFEVRKDPRHDFGLFLDTRSSRDWIRKVSKKKKILNLFSYSCAFAVAASFNGAEAVTNIDPSKEYLAWGKRNADLNNIDFRNYSDTAQKYLPRHLKRLEKGTDDNYDIIITDPPAFLVGRGDDRLGRKYWPGMLENMLAAQPKKMLLICNDKAFRGTRNLNHFLENHLKSKYMLKPLKQSSDVLGQGLDKNKDNLDTYYIAPQVFIASSF